MPGERYTHGTRIKVFVVSVRKELRGRYPGLTDDDLIRIAADLPLTDGAEMETPSKTMAKRF